MFEKYMKYGLGLFDEIEKRMHGDYFRHGDLHFSKEKYKVEKIILRHHDRNLRYHVEGFPQTSFLRDELIV